MTAAVRLTQPYSRWIASVLIVECAFEHVEYLTARLRVALNSGTGIELHKPDRLRFMFMKMYDARSRQAAWFPIGCRLVDREMPIVVLFELAEFH